MNNTILISGIFGFIGSHLADTLMDLGYNVIGVDDMSKGDPANLKYHPKVFVRDINDNLDDIFKEFRPEYVYNLAAFIDLRKSFITPLDCFDTNVLGSINLITTAVKYKVKKFIFSSTGGAIYSDSILPFTEYSNALPASPYGLSKLTIERYLEIVNKTNGLNYVNLRFGNVFGPRQDPMGEAGVISIFLDKILKNKPITIFGDGKQTRDYVFVKNIISACVLALDSNIVGTLNVGSGVEKSVNDIVAELQKHFDFEINYSPAIPGEMLRSVLNSNKLKNLGWKPKYTFEQGLNETIKYFKEKNRK